MTIKDTALRLLGAALASRPGNYVIRRIAVHRVLIYDEDAETAVGTARKVAPV